MTDSPAGPASPQQPPVVPATAATPPPATASAASPPPLATPGPPMTPTSVSAPSAQTPPPYPAGFPATAAPLAPPPPPPRRRSVGWIVTVSLLSVGLLAAVGAVVWYFLQLERANATIREQERELEEQRELIDRKDTFAAAMASLLDEVGAYEGVPLATVIPWDRYELLASQAWARRWNADALDSSIASVETARDELVAQREAAAQEAAVNASGSAYEATLDRLGAGFVTWRLDDADALCESDVLACVTSDEPLVVHVDAPDDSLPYMTDWLRTGLAYHEFAHVLQFTNPEPTETAVEAFDGDVETMADCFALTYLDGWTLDHRVWVNSYEYWDVSLGYGYTCDDAQRQVIRDWYGKLGVHAREISS